MTPKTFLAPLLCASALITQPCLAATPDPSKQESGAVDGWQKSNARRAAVTLLEDVRMLDAAIDQWAIENNKKAGDMPTPQELALYLKKGTRLHTALTEGSLNDALGNPMTLRGVDKVPLISQKSVAQFTSVVEPGFWGPYYEGPELSTVKPEAAPANPITKADLRLSATRLLEEMRMLDAAIDMWAIEHNKRDGAQPTHQDLAAYLKKGTRLHAELAAGRLNDSLGNPISIPPVGEIPTINAETEKRLSTTVSDDFWGPFVKKKKQ